MTKIIVRVQSPVGTKRIDTSTTEKTSNFYEKVYETFGLLSLNFALYKQRDKTQEIISSRSKSLFTYGIRHGDILYLWPLNGMSIFPTGEVGEPNNTAVATTSTVATTSSTLTNANPSRLLSVVEDDVDVHLQKEDGRIDRPRDERLCHHNANSKCIHCAPLEPYDDEYLRQQNVKHVSFHGFIRKLKGGADKGKFVALENISCKIKSGCQDHPPWPKGICSKCQPNAITLNRQIYRHVDNVVFENPQLVERFLNYWRTTGHQRIGFLIGTYEMHKDVPLGIKATVSAIYEPPQDSTRDSIQLHQDDRLEIVNELAKTLGHRVVGWIFTDLIAEDIKKGTVQHFRNVSSHFLSAQECIMAGYFQNHYPNMCRLSTDGYFGSKFVTVCVTGDIENQVHMEGYQVSNQCMALVRDGCLVPTKDAPELGYVRESSNEQYVPDVFYKEKDNYGNEVMQLARPLPIEYLLLDVPVSTPMEPKHTFTVSDKRPFPVENRFIDGHIQDFSALSSYLQQFDKDDFLTAASDFHFLLYIATMDTLPLKEYMSPLLEAVKNKDAGLANEWAKSEQWATVEQLMAAQSVSSPSSPGQASTSYVDRTWTCQHCTYINNASVSQCEICSLPQ